MLLQGPFLEANRSIGTVQNFSPLLLYHGRRSETESIIPRSWFLLGHRDLFLLPGEISSPFLCTAPFHYGPKILSAQAVQLTDPPTRKLRMLAIMRR